MAQTHTSACTCYQTRAGVAAEKPVHSRRRSTLSMTTRKKLTEHTVRHKTKSTNQQNSFS